MSFSSLAPCSRSRHMRQGLLTVHTYLDNCWQLVWTESNWKQSLVTVMPCSNYDKVLSNIIRSDGFRAFPHLTVLHICLFGCLFVCNTDDKASLGKGNPQLTMDIYQKIDPYHLKWIILSVQTKYKWVWSCINLAMVRYFKFSLNLCLHNEYYLSCKLCWFLLSHHMSWMPEFQLKPCPQYLLPVRK